MIELNPCKAWNPFPNGLKIKYCTWLFILFRWWQPYIFVYFPNHLATLSFYNSDYCHMMANLRVRLHTTWHPYVQIQAVFSAFGSHSDEEIDRGNQLRAVDGVLGGVSNSVPRLDRLRFLPSKIVDRRSSKRDAEVLLVESISNLKLTTSSYIIHLVDYIVYFIASWCSKLLVKTVDTTTFCRDCSKQSV